MNPVAEAISVGSLSSLNLCGDPCGMRFGTAIFFVAVQYSVTLGWCTQWRQGKRVDFTVQWTAVLAVPRLVHDPALQHQYEGIGPGKPTTPIVLAKVGIPASAAPVAPADIIGDPVEARTASTQFRTAMVASEAQGASTGIEVCAPFVNQPFEWDIHGTVILTTFFCVSRNPFIILQFYIVWYTCGPYRLVQGDQRPLAATSRLAPLSHSSSLYGGVLRAVRVPCATCARCAQSLCKPVPTLHNSA